VPRIRSVHPEICHDEAIAEISPHAFRTWILLWTQLDDEGRGQDNAKLWAGLLYPLNDKMTADRVERDLAELAEATLLIRYEVDGRRYLAAKPESWKRRQRPQKPTTSKLPPVPTTGPTRVVPSGALPHGGGGVLELEMDKEREGESEGEGSARPASGPQGSKLAAIAARHANGHRESA
jgi:hypothetical protein